jgi:hypothetical protein
LKSIVFISILMLSSWAQAKLCVELWGNPSIPQPQDNYRAYAVSHPDAYGVTRIHAVGFDTRESTRNFSRRDLLDIVATRELQGRDDRDLTMFWREIQASYDAFLPLVAQETSRQWDQSTRRRLWSRVLRERSHDRFADTQSHQWPHHFFYDSENSLNLMFMAQIQTTQGPIDIIFSKPIQLATMRGEALAYAFDIAQTLGFEVERVTSLLIYGGNPSSRY